MKSVSNLIPNLFEVAKYSLHTGTLRNLQIAALEPVLSGRTLLICAPTGAGKTEAVLIPLFENILEHDFRKDRICSRILYICPTKALINDLYHRFEWAYDSFGIRLGRKTGDVNEVLRKPPPQIIITTPESLDVLLGTPVDHFNDRFLQIHGCLSTIRVVVVDEVHQFVGTVRGIQLAWLLSRLKLLTQKDLQMVGMSATIPDTGHVKRFLADFGGEVQEVSSSEIRRELNFNLGEVGSFQDLADAVDLARTKWNAGKILIFANSRRECDDIFENLTGLCQDPNESVLIHYSTLSFEERSDTEAELKFKKGKAICIATSTLELGIDVGDIDAVFLFGAPSSIGSFVQKIGRGDRRRKIIRVVGLVRNMGERNAAQNDIALFLSLLASYFEDSFEPPVKSRCYSVAIQQLFSLMRQHGKLPMKRVTDVNLRLPSETRLEPDEMYKILDSLVRARFISKPLAHIDEFALSESADFMIKKRRIFGNIGAEIAGRLCFFRKGDKLVAEFPFRENKDLIEIGDTVLIGGKYYRIEDIELGRGYGRVLVSDADRDGNVKKLKYKSLFAPVSFFLANRLTRTMDVRVLDRTSIHPNLRDRIKSWVSVVNSLGQGKRIFFFPKTGEYVYYTFAGTVGNFLLSKVFGGKWFDEFRVVYSRPIDSFEVDETQVKKVISENVPDFAGMFSCSKFFSMLPDELQVVELFSRIEPGLLDFLFSLKEMELRILHQDLFASLGCD